MPQSGLSPEMLTTASLGLGAAVLMIRIGIGKRVLRMRRSPRCASCGRDYSGRFCPRCTIR